jgi:hypothetical protein
MIKAIIKYSFLLFEIDPQIKSGQKNSKEKYGPSGKFKIHHLFHIVDDERSRIVQGRIMLLSQPDLKIGEGAIPT